MIDKDSNLNELIRQRTLELDASEARFDNIVSISTDGIVIVDGIGMILFVNPAAITLFGLKAEKLLGEHFGFPIVAGETTELEINNRERKLTIAEMRVVVTEWEGKPAYLATLRDITERKQSEKALQKEKELAEALRLEKEATEDALRKEQELAEMLRVEKRAAETTARVKSQFLANMSHELRTPMTGVLGMLQLALEEDIAPVPRGYLETSLTSARSLLRILNDILDMAKIEAGKLTIEEKPFSLLRCITEAADIMTPEVRRKGLDFSISVAEEIPDMVVGDQMRLRQVLINLIGNAVKFTDGGKVVVRLTAERPTPDGQWEFTIFVTDTGIGISDDKKGLLFRTFSQVDDSHSRSFGGTGLGLAISRKIMELMGGTISFESKAGVGSTFSFTIPLEEASLKSGTLLAVKPQSTRTTTPTPEEKSRSLLLAEDDATIREVLGRLLKRSKYSVDFAEDGLEAVEMWEAGGYDLVLMDVQMPRLNGFEATRAIREKELECGCHTPIVAMTAHATIEDEQMCLDADMDAYISKPIDFKKTLQVIEEIFQKKSSGCC